jgi:S-adenosylmethionine-diacylgycerolhomoserine-N-methlytransferase
VNPVAATSDAERMDRIYRWQTPLYDLTRRYYLIGRDRLIAELDPPVGGTVLEIGCGTGRNLVAAARRHPNARYFGIDVSRVMLDKAQSAVDAAGLGEQISMALADATTFDPAILFGRRSFDRIFFSYTLSMIPQWPAALDAAMQALSPDGRLLVVDFGMMERLPRWMRRGLRAWLAAFSVEPRSELAVELASIAARHGFATRTSTLLGGYGVYGMASRR